MNCKECPLSELCLVNESSTRLVREAECVVLDAEHEQLTNIMATLEKKEENHAKQLKENERHQKFLRQGAVGHDAQFEKNMYEERLYCDGAIRKRRFRWFGRIVGIECGSSARKMRVDKQK